MNHTVIYNGIFKKNPYDYYIDFNPTAFIPPFFSPLVPAVGECPKMTVVITGFTPTFVVIKIKHTYIDVGATTKTTAKSFSSVDLVCGLMQVKGESFMSICQS